MKQKNRHSDTMPQQESARKIPGVGRRQIAKLMIQLADLLEAGCPLSRALDAIARQSSDPPLTQLAGALNGEIINGASLSGAMQRFNPHFSSVHISMIQAAEAGGFLQETLSNLADHITHQNQAAKQIRSKLAYPAFLAATILASVIFLLTFVVPRFTKVYSSANQELPAITKGLLDISGFVTGHWLALVIAIVLLGVFLRGLMRLPVTRMWWDSVSLQLPILGRIIRDWETYRFAQTMSLLLSGGLPVLRSLRLTVGVVGNRVVRDEIDAMAGAVESGEALSEPMRNSRFFDSTTMEMIVVSEATGKLAEVLQHLATQRSRDFQMRVEVLLSLVEPVIIVVMALLVGVTVAAMLLPVLTMNSLIS